MICTENLFFSRQIAQKKGIDSHSRQSQILYFVFRRLAAEQSYLSRTEDTVAGVTQTWQDVVLLVESLIE